MRFHSRLILLDIMDLKFKFNANEFAKINSITTSALRKRRLRGKLEGKYIKKDGKYFYSNEETARPNKDEFTLPVVKTKVRRRKVPEACTRYHNARNGHQLKLTNDLRQLARINRRLNEEQITEITDDIFEVAKQRRAKRLNKQIQTQDIQIRQSNYGGFNQNSFVDVKTNWRPLFPEARNEYQKYLDNNDIKPNNKEIY